MKRPRAIILVLPLIASLVHAGEVDPLDPSRARRDDQNSTLLWYDARLLPIEGQAWQETKAPYDRLPARAEGLVRDAVWNLSRTTPGIVVRFTTNATAIDAQWVLTSDRLAMPHMPATGVSGLDLYVRDEAGQWRWLACARPSGQTNSARLISGIPSGAREYMLYLPLYNGISSLEIGIDSESWIAPAPPRTEQDRRPIVFYGTSITHGASASRSGMTHVALLGRRFDRPVINLGFSGNGRLEPEVVELLAEIDAAVFVIDCLPNVDANVVSERAEPCLAILRAVHPTTPILLVEDRSYADSFLVTSKRERNLSSRQALRAVYEARRSAGDQHLHYLPGEHLLGDDNEGTVDSSHPTDLGFMRQADAFATALAPLLDPQTP